ncbi:amidohydrolase-like protein 2 [Xylogone sp. PMI_703]|nr:amidohydrolase-like protein 2 [Xylogone sp. PMI_703]
MKGTIALEEALLLPGDTASIDNVIPIMLPHASPTAKGELSLRDQLLDIHQDRLRRMDSKGVEFMILSLLAPGPQGIANVEEAEANARTVNDYLSHQVSLNPKRFGAFASLSMHRPQQAAQELTRAVKDLGLLGAMINDFQSAGEDGNTKIYYDTPDFDPFWRVVQDLGVPVYLHPRPPPPSDMADRYRTRPLLIGPDGQFSQQLSFHIQALCISGVFDKFPGVQLIIGHLGESNPFSLWRSDHWSNNPARKPARPAKQDYSFYFKHNIYITTSGFFSTRSLKFCIQEIGADRCLYSIDFPLETIEDGQDWWESVDLPVDQKERIGRGNAIHLLKLPLEN